MYLPARPLHPLAHEHQWFRQLAKEFLAEPRLDVEEGRARNRSRNTKPKVMVSTHISLVSYFIRLVPRESG
jgi:hypothetical protein